MLSFLKRRKAGFPLFFCQIPKLFIFSANMQCRHLFALVICGRCEAVKTQNVLKIQVYILQWLQILSVIFSTRLGDGVYDTFMMIDETKCPPCSNVLCNPSEPPLPRRLNVSKVVLCSLVVLERRKCYLMPKVQLHLTGNPDSFVSFWFLLTLK